MGNESMEINMVQHRKAWLERLIKELEKLEPLMPIKLMPEGEYPDWVLKVESHIANALFPVARLRVESEITPAKLGALLGHTCASAVWMMEWFKKCQIVSMN